MPFPQQFRIKHRLLPAFFLFLPASLSTLVTSFCYSSRTTPSARLLGFLQDIPLRYLGTFSLSISSFPRLSLCARSSLRPHCSTCCRQCRRRSPRRISSSELARRVLTSTKPSSMALQSRNPFNPRRRKTTYGRWTYGMGRSTALAPCPFLQKPIYLTPSYFKQIRTEPPWR